MAWPPVVDILMYAVVLSGGPTALSCEATSADSVVCSNGTTAKWNERTNLVSVNGNPVYYRDGHYEFLGTLMTGARNSFGWTVFTNGVMVRRDYLGGHPDAWFINPDLLCETTGERTAACRKR